MKNYLVNVTYTLGMGLIVSAESKQAAVDAVESAVNGHGDVCIDILTDRRAEADMNVWPEPDGCECNWDGSALDYAVNKDGELIDSTEE